MAESIARIQTRSGLMLNVLSPAEWTDDEIRLTDIAAALAHTCRFNGHCHCYYSVADHCCNVLDVALGSMRGSRVDHRLALLALLHDAAEAYIGDTVHPIKSAVPELRSIEDRIERRIYQRFGLDILNRADDHQRKRVVRDADRRMLCTEAERLMGVKAGDWTYPDPWQPVEGIEFPAYTHEQSAKRWLFRVEWHLESMQQDMFQDQWPQEARNE